MAHFALPVKGLEVRITVPFSVGWSFDLPILRCRTVRIRIMGGVNNWGIGGIFGKKLCGTAFASGLKKKFLSNHLHKKCKK
jgi:hypothetical protein